MTDHKKQRNSEEIEKDINQSRERLDSTLREIEERFSPQQLLNTSYEYLRHGGANEFVSNLGTSVKQNPLPVLVASAGLGWLVLSQRNPSEGGGQHQFASATDRRFYSGGQSSNTVGAFGTSSVPVHEGTHPNESMHHDSNMSVETERHGGSKGRVSEATHKAKDSAQHLGQKAKQAAQQWGDKAQHLGDNMRDSTSDMQHGAQDNLHNMGERARQAEGQASDFIKEHPLVVGALGFAIGAALGGIFPATKKEDEYFGEYRDRALDKAAETGQEHMEKAQHSIHEKAESFKGESQQPQGANTAESKDASANAPQDSEARVKDSPTPTTERSVPKQGGADQTSAEIPTPERPNADKTSPEKASSERHGSERHSLGLTGSSTPSGNTQGSGTNHTT